MSDWGQGGTAAFAGQPAANDGVTAGALLRRAREAAGLHVAALAVSLKVPVRKLEALEEDRWDLLPDAVFARALASTICRTLKIDSQPVLDRMPHTTAPRLIQTGEGLNAPFRAPTDSAAPGWVDQLSRPAFLVVFALLLGALVLILLPTMENGDPVTAGGATPANTPAQVLMPSPAVRAATGVTAANAEQPRVEAAGTTSAVQPAANATATGLPAAAAPASAPGGVAAGEVSAKPVAATEAQSAPAAAADSAAVAQAPAAAASGIVVFRTKNPSWVEVTDAKGVVAIRRLLAPGEAAGASGSLPLRVVIGRVDATEVQVRGKPFDLRAVSRDNVARFEVK